VKNPLTMQHDFDSRAILIGLIMPTIMVMFNVSMFGVALPAVRSTFNAQADLIAWVVTGYNLSFAILMPLYGRLGDGLGKRKLLLVGTGIFILGTCISILAPDLRFLMMGRTIQGAGASSAIPLAIAIISDFFPANQRGKALGTWNSIGPAARIVAPLTAGFLIETWGWRTIFGPPLLFGLLAPFAVWRFIPRSRNRAGPGYIHSFDWVGVALLGTAVTTFLFYLSSRPITGVAPLRDGRLLAMTVLFSVGFFLWERRRANPFISFDILSHGQFARSSLCAGLRMYSMSGIGFLLPLYLADVQSLGASWIGLMLLVHSGAILTTLRFGGQLADRWSSSRWPVVIGLSMQAGAMINFATLRGSAGLAPVVAGLAIHGLGAGLALAALHRVAMKQVPQEEMGVAAGLYSMIRFFGTVLGTTLGGVLLQFSLDSGLSTIAAYQAVYWVVVGVVSLGVVVGLTLRE
jgi:EmrB/QacA subfamily drug resistance transporter